MGSMTRFSAIERFEKEFGKKFEEAYHHLMGATVTKMTGKEVSYHVKADIELTMTNGDSDVFEVHHRWATQEEDGEGEELTDYTMEEYFEDHLKGKKVIALHVGSTDRDDEAYLIATLDNNECIEIALGFNSEFGTFEGISEFVLSNEERCAFLER